MTDNFSTDRRALLKGAAASAALLAPGATLAQSRRDGDREAIRRAVDAGYEEFGAADPAVDRAADDRRRSD